MKTLATVSAVTLLATLAMSPVSAGPATDKEKALGAAKFTAGALVGGLVGGPLGAVVGALGGGLFAEQEFKSAASARELASAQENLSQLKRDIAMQEVKIAELEQESLAALELKVLFDTGVDQVSGLDAERLKRMADYLLENSELLITLDGHADPRGTDEYNNVLSHERALTVKNVLVEQGIAEERIQVYSYGSSRSSANRGDMDDYTQERRVGIKLSPRLDETMAQQDVNNNTDWPVQSRTF